MGADTVGAAELAYWLTSEEPEAVAWRGNAELCEWARLLVAYRLGQPVARPAGLPRHEATASEAATSEATAKSTRQAV